MPSWLKPVPGGIEVSLYVQPRASRTKPVGEHGEALKLQVAAPPVEGEANAELTRYLAKTFGVPKAQVELLSGDTSRHKRFRISGATEAQALEALAASGERQR
jgi:uncharacterized protein (TIGR00251 family)